MNLDATRPNQPKLRQSEIQRRKLHRRQRRAVLVSAAFVGLAAGALAVVYQIAVTYAERVSHQVAAISESLGPAGWIWLALMGGSLGGCAGWVTGRFCPEAGGSGVPHIKAVLMNLRQIRPVALIPTKLGGGLLALASGMSLGREGPTIQIGGAIGKLVARIGKSPRRSHPTLIASGAGAGLAAAFNAPLAGFIFVMEELKREMSPLTYGAALIASVAAVAVARVELGQRTSFLLKNPTPVPLRALPLVILLAVVAGLLAVAFNRAVMGLIAVRARWKWPRWLAGALVGVVAVCLIRLLPVATGSGHGVTENILSGAIETQLTIGVVALALLAKFVMTSASFSTGVPGGIFAPILAMGALTGYLCGTGFALWFPALGVSPPVFATIGMAAFLAGSIRAPLTGVVLIVEMTQQYSLLYALLVGAFVSYLLADLIKDKPIYEALLERDLQRTEEFGNLPDVAVPIDLIVEPDSFMDGRFVRHLNLPAGALIVTVERDGGVIVPNGGTRIHYGDHVSVMLSGENTEAALLALHDAAQAPRA